MSVYKAHLSVYMYCTYTCKKPPTGGTPRSGSGIWPPGFRKHPGTGGVPGGVPGRVAGGGSPPWGMSAGMASPSPSESVRRGGGVPPLGPPSFWVSNILFSRSIKVRRPFRPGRRVGVHFVYHLPKVIMRRNALLVKNQTRKCDHEKPFFGTPKGWKPSFQWVVDCWRYKLNNFRFFQQRSKFALFQKWRNFVRCWNT